MCWDGLLLHRAVATTSSSSAASSRSLVTASNYIAALRGFKA